MLPQNITLHRLCNQQIAAHNFKTPGEVVRWLGAVQAQDYLGSLWAIGLRLHHTNESEIEQAIVNKTMVRTWPMRGTLHFVAPEDIRWMLQLLTPRVISRSAGLYKQKGLDKKTLVKSRKVFIKALEGGKSLARNELYTVLDRSKIDSGDQRGLHILGHHAQEGLICFGPRNGKQQTFVLLDEWIPTVKTLKKDEALAELAKRYFQSHAPATIADFAWWSGLSKAEAVEAFGLIKSVFNHEAAGNKDFLIYPSSKTAVELSHTAYLLPSYDEYLVSYKDRSAAVDPKVKATGQNLIFTPIVVIDGLIHGTWKRTIENKKAYLEVKSLTKLTKAKTVLIHQAAERYSQFLGIPVNVV